MKAPIGLPRYSDGLKRALDLAGSVVLMLLGLPVLAAAAVAIVATDGPPVIFKQQRAGRGGKPFRLYKFRTMRNGTEEKYRGFPSPDTVTRVGSLLRRLSIDELPQLLNIFLGEMSFVGPRPALISQVDRYTDEQMGRLAVRPGVTGLAQVRFRNNAPWSRRIKADLEYISRISILQDTHLVLATVRNVLSGKDQIVGQTAADVDDLSYECRPIQDVTP